MSSMGVFKPNERNNEFILTENERKKALNWLTALDAFLHRTMKPGSREQQCGEEEVLELLVLQGASTLVICLAHFNIDVRDGALHCLLRLANIFQDFDVKHHLKRIGSLCDAHLIARELMRTISCSVRCMALGFVSQLEALYKHKNLKVRNIAISCATSLVQNCSDVFSNDIAAVWNLVFLLDSAPPPNKFLVSGSRVAIINAIGELSSLYCSRSDTALISQVITKLLSIPELTLDEETSVKNAVCSVYSHLEPSSSLADNTERKSVTRKGAPFNAYIVLQTLLTSHREEQYDMIQWAVRELTQRVLRHELCSEMSATTTVPSSVIWFAEAISLNLNAAPAFVRYGSILSLLALFETCSCLWEKIPQVFRLVINGCVDHHPSIRKLNLCLLHLLAKQQELHELVDVIALHNSRYTNTNAGASLENVIREAVLKSPNLPAAELLTCMSAVRFIPTQTAQLDQLMLIHHWCKRCETLDSNTMHQLLPLLHIAPLQHAALKVFQSLSHVLHEISQSLLLTTDAYVHQTLFDGDDEAQNILALDVLAALPLQRLPTEHLQKMLDTDIASKLFSNCLRLRIRAYQFVAQCCHFWCTPDLMMRALTILLVGVGDVAADGCRGAVDALLMVTSSSQQETTKSSEAVGDVLREKKNELQNRNYLTRLRALDMLANAVAAPDDDQFQAGIIQHLQNPVLYESIKTRLEALRTQKTMSRHTSQHTQHPVWYALLLSKLNIHINQCPAENSLQPLMASPRRAERKLAVHTLKRACFTANTMNTRCLELAVNNAVAAVTDSMSIQLQDAAIQLLEALVTMHIPHLNLWLTHQLLAPLADMLYANAFRTSTTRHTLALVSLLLMNAMANATTNDIVTACCERLRDAARKLLCTGTQELSEMTRTLYTLIARCISTLDNAVEYVEFLIADIVHLTHNKYNNDDTNANYHHDVMAQADPLLSKLSNTQRQIIAQCSIRALSNAVTKHHQSMRITVNNLLPLLCHHNAHIRLHTVQAIIHITHNTHMSVSSASSSASRDADDNEGALMASCLWQIAPLLCDPELDVRVVLHTSALGGGVHVDDVDVRVRRMTTPEGSKRCEVAVMAPQPDKEYSLDTEFVLSECTLSVEDGNESASIIGDELGCMWDGPIPANVLRRPSIDTRLAVKIRTRLSDVSVALSSGSVEASHTIDALFLFLENIALRGAGALMLGEIGAQVATHGELVRIVGALHSLLDISCSADSNFVLNGSTLGLRAIACRPTCVEILLPETMRHIRDLRSLRDGNVLALHSVLNTIHQHTNIKLAETLTVDDVEFLVEMISQALNSSLISTSARLVALDLVVLLSAFLPDGRERLLNVTLTIIDDATANNELQASGATALKQMLEGLPMNDTVIQKLVQRLEHLQQDSDDDIKTTTSSNARHKRLTLLSVLSDVLDENVMLENVVALFADPDANVRHRVVNMVLDGSLSQAVRDRFEPALTSSINQQQSEKLAKKKKTTSTSMESIAESVGDSAGEYGEASSPESTKIRLDQWDYTTASMHDGNAPFGIDESFNYSSTNEEPYADAADNGDNGNGNGDSSGNYGNNNDPLNIKYLRSDRYSAITAHYDAKLYSQLPEDFVNEHHDADDIGKETLGAPRDWRCTSAMKLHSVGAEARERSRRSAHASQRSLANAMSAHADDEDIEDDDDGELNDITLTLRDGDKKLARDTCKHEALSQTQIQQVLKAALNLNATQSDEILDKLLQSLETPLPDVSGASLPSSVRKKQHNISVLVNVVLSMDNSIVRSISTLVRLTSVYKTYSIRSKELRSKMIESIDELMFRSTEPAPMIVANPDMFTRIQQHNRDVLASRNDSEKLAELLRARQELHAKIEDVNGSLFACTTLQIDVLHSLGRMYSTIPICGAKLSESEDSVSDKVPDSLDAFVVDAMRFTLSTIDDEHDKVRRVGIDTFNAVIKSPLVAYVIEQNKQKKQENESNVVDDVIDDFWCDTVTTVIQRLTDDVGFLGCRKIDLISILASVLRVWRRQDAEVGNVVTAAPSEEFAAKSESSSALCRRALNTFLALWDDENSSVRSRAIDVFRELDNSATIAELTSMLSYDASHTSLLMNEASIRLTREKYGSKEKIQQFIEWMYERARHLSG